MKLAEALRLLHGAESDGPLSTLYLACGFEPLHFLTFLKAHCRLARPGRPLRIEQGLYGDITGNIGSAKAQASDHLLLLLEWADLDPRLGLRMPALWNADTIGGIADEAESRLIRLEQALSALPSSVAVVGSLPTLPFPPVGFTAPWLTSDLESELEEKLQGFRRRTMSRGVKWLSAGALAMASPAAARYDCKSDLSSGFPYGLAHASHLAELVCRLLFPPAPKKGLISDLDNTLWQGIVGEDGPDGVSWNLDHDARAHGLYQQLLRSLAESGVLVAIASKNDPASVDAAFLRDDLLLGAEHVFPMEVHWGPKSASVERIAKVWNIGLDSVVFVDDSALERDEVARAHPEMECLEFPGDPAGVEKLCRRLREIFGRDRITGEDRLRQASIRRNQELHELIDRGEADEAFLAGLQARLVLDGRRSNPDPRALELLNKTNQFNLNGRRLEEAEWRRFLDRPNAFALLVSYEDRFGPLGKIAVLAGTHEGNCVTVEHWVMSCRAFSRRIEHACLRYLFEDPATDTVVLQFAATPRNGPTQDFLRPWHESLASGSISISRTAMIKDCPAIHHKIEDHATREAADRETFA